MPVRSESSKQKALRDLGRAGGGALLFSLPMLMTMEMWSLGLYLERWRLLVLLLSALPVLVVLSRQIGFEDARSWGSSVLDSLMALGIATCMCTLLLWLFGAFGPGTPADEAIGKVAIQTIPAAIGALLAKSQLGVTDTDAERKDETYGGELFLMGIGALFLAFNIAPTEEMALISFRITSWHALALVALSLLVMHAFVFALGFSGGTQLPSGRHAGSAFLLYTLPGYVIAFAVSYYLLWVLARTSGASLDAAVMSTVVLTFPAAIGAAAARLIL